jgi:potassium channel
MEFGFFRGLPEKLFLLDIVGQAAFMVDIFMNFFVGYHDSHTYRMIYSHKSIAIRYLLSSLLDHETVEY